MKTDTVHSFPTKDYNCNFAVVGKDPSVRGTPITSGISANAVNYRACEDVIQFVILNNFQKIVPPRNQNIFAFSGYYYTVLEAGIIPPQGRLHLQ